MVRTIYQQLSPAEVHGQLDRVVEQLREPFPQVAELLADAAPDILAFTAFPVAHWQKLWSNNPQERLNREIRRRRLPPKGDVVGIFPNRLSARRLVGAVLAEQHDEWAEARRYLTIPNAAGNEALPEPNMLDAARDLVPRQLYLPVGVNQFCRFTSLAWPRCWAALVR